MQAWWQLASLAEQGGGVVGVGPEVAVGLGVLVGTPGGSVAVGELQLAFTCPLLQLFAPPPGTVIQAPPLAHESNALWQQEKSVLAPSLQLAVQAQGLLAVPAQTGAPGAGVLVATGIGVLVGAGLQDELPVVQPLGQVLQDPETTSN